MFYDAGGRVGVNKTHILCADWLFCSVSIKVWTFR